ncbi:YybH family protein [Actinoplanes sp. CA-030573]|uniref:YybH family protein n=1 Tax=Actinoplanes sp. CA-030573 TaxID=3239898 RepID=UPI003D94E158
MEFAEAVEAHLAAVSARDLDGYLKSVHDDVSLVLPNGRLIEGREAISEFHREWFGDPDWSWELSRLRTATVGETGMALCQVAYHDLDAEGRPYTMRYLLSLTFAQVGGDWLLLHDQNTPTS